MTDQEKQLDRLLDSLLANYADVEPRPGLETRLLASLRVAQTSSTKSWDIWRWLLAGAGAVAMAVAVFALYYSRLAELPAAPAIQVAGPPILLPTTTPRGRVVPPHRQKSRVETPPLAAHVDVRQEVFPTPIPLSEQEKLLLRYLAGTPRDEVLSQAHEDEPKDGIDLSRPQTQRLNGTETYSTQ